MDKVKEIVIKGVVNNPMNIVLEIYKLKLPKEIIKIIVEFAVPIMFCNSCGCVLQKNNFKTLHGIGWMLNINDNNLYIKCKYCVPSLKDYWNKKLKLT